MNGKGNLRFGELRKKHRRIGIGERMFLLNGKTEKTIGALKTLLLTERQKFEFLRSYYGL